MTRRPDPEYAPDRLTAYEIPLRTGDALRTPHDIAAILRTVHTGTHISPATSSRRRVCAASCSWLRTGSVSTSTPRRLPPG